MRWASCGAMAVVLLAGVGGAAAGCGGGESGPPEINLYNAPQENIGRIVARCNRRAAGRYRITLNTLPRDADGQREQMVRRLAAGDTGLDVLGLDVMWTAELAEAEWILPWTGAYERQVRRGTLPKPLETATWDGRLYAAPYTTNVQLLWYRSDLVPKPPTTWNGLIRESDRLAAEGRPHYAEVTGAPYEGIVVWFNSVLASAGGSILNTAGETVMLGPPATRALGVMRAFGRSRAADPSISSMREDDVRLAMEGGRAAFQINWPFVYASMAANKPRLLPDFKWAPYPGVDGPGRAPLGGANFGISRYTEHPREAFEAALCLRDPQSQLTAAVMDGLPPTIRTVYDAPQMAEAYPMRQAILDALETAALRPRTPTYQNVSTVTSTILSPPGSIDPVKTEARLRDLISDALESKGVLP
ncbi:ABC transporter substrate-binding protein [Thermomonospora umbrina]|uniref:Carbohydrate ABC transporter substrate-binding protein (CUT1 family) n=1 Tax=Thermomonospora umbrina TaxID=111806 RepID=A0A3D9SYR5_9ACTN|nr:ABC transporter substrate-binding protein [Thermomonospora umbrina]REE96761.1 carbohydrate ABC transporter substrate-binding protein (CUT1 family) [Thermomonospora umbrina]